MNIYFKNVPYNHLNKQISESSSDNDWEENNVCNDKVINTCFQ